MSRDGGWGSTREGRGARARDGKSKEGGGPRRAAVHRQVAGVGAAGLAQMEPAGWGSAKWHHLGGLML